MGRPIESLEISVDQRRELERIANAPTTEQRLARRARIVLLRAEGRSQMETAATVGVNRPVVLRWEHSFAKLGLAGLEEAPGRGLKPSIPEAKRQKLIVQATQPPPNRTRWSVRSMARQVGVSPASVQRIWAANEIKPHLTRTFKLSRGPNFEAKFWDVIGLYLNPPDKALVLCCEEKRQCQALERTQPDLPLGIGHIRTRTHDYIRPGTVTTPTSSSWMNLLERFFRQLADDVVREGSFANVNELVTAINVHLAHHNLSPTPYRWKADGAAILQKIQRARLAQNESIV